MIIRVESGLTLQVDGAHYVKETVAIEMDHEEVARLLDEVVPMHSELPSYEEINDTVKALQVNAEDAVLEAVLDQIKNLRKSRTP